MTLQNASPGPNRAPMWTLRGAAVSSEDPSWGGRGSTGSVCWRKIDTCGDTLHTHRGVAVRVLAEEAHLPPCPLPCWRGMPGLRAPPSGSRRSCSE